MLKTLLFSVLVIPTFLFAQTKYESEKYKFSVSYPDGWDEMKNGEDDIYSLIYKFDPTGKPRLAVAYTVVIEPASVGGNTDKMLKNYQKALHRRTDFESEEILSHEVIDYQGVKAIKLFGMAKVKVVNQVMKWQMLLFEYGDYYYEISFTGKKSHFNKSKTQKDFKMMYDSFRLLI